MAAHLYPVVGTGTCPVPILLACEDFILVATTLCHFLTEQYCGRRQRAEGKSLLHLVLRFLLYPNLLS